MARLHPADALRARQDRYHSDPNTRINLRTDEMDRICETSDAIREHMPMGATHDKWFWRLEEGWGLRLAFTKVHRAIDRVQNRLVQHGVLPGYFIDDVDVNEEGLSMAEKIALDELGEGPFLYTHMHPADAALWLRLRCERDAALLGREYELYAADLVHPRLLRDISNESEEVKMLEAYKRAWFSAQRHCCAILVTFHQSMML
ncbi:hypothetical protein BD626DRAFT_595972 [Schizophyllum amplum]|uniref:Uncharacterized protein n=1 Tax=Schizophyllum amplum TaxID=97359 RepID=A0A550CCD0_9AGAR|nr:hypothetical protein BD626DRAFT_595972 [Auriculariopsis ampla]